MCQLKIINDKKIWNDFIINWDFEFYSFVNSWQWGEFQELEWNKTFRYWIYENDNLIGEIQLIKVEAKRWTYFFTPHWPLIKWDYFDVLEKISTDLKEIAKENWCSFIRLNPNISNTKENKIKYSKLNYIDAPMHIHAEDTHLLALWKTEEELLKWMKSKDKYFINRARKEWVEIKIWNDEEHITTLIEYHRQHANRDNWKNKYHAFSEKYVRNLYKVFDESEISTISASYNWFCESILMTIKFWKTCVYYIAASKIKSKKFSPNYLCQWEAIMKANNEWCSVYNFWGISPDDNPLHPISWVTKFKRKFWGYDYSLLHAQDMVVSNVYWLNWAIETFRRKKRWYYYKKPQ